VQSGGKTGRRLDMSFRNTIVLLAILAILGGIVAYLRISQKEESFEAPPDVWSYDDNKIEHITLQLPREKQSISFVKNKKKESWFFDTQPRKPVFLRRWGGIVLLLSGPQSRRVIADKVTDMDLYGLNDPSMVITLRITDQSQKLTVVVGDRTPDDKAVYVILKEHQTVYLLDHTWYEVMLRLVREPPEQIIRPRISDGSKA